MSSRKAMNTRVFQTMRSVGIPGTYICWGEGQAPSLPWFTYRVDGPSSVKADNINYEDMPTYRVELYMKRYDAELISKFEQVIEREFGAYGYDDVYVQSEKCYMASFTFSVI